MAQVIVTFVGICTHLGRQHMEPPEDALSPPSTAVGHYSRFVAVNGRFGARLANHAIPPHVQHLHIPPEYISHQSDDAMAGLESLASPSNGWWSMNGIRLYVANAVPGLSFSPHFQRLPSLTDTSGELSLELDPRVVMDGRAACQFEIYGGAFDAYKVPGSHDAMTARVTITTTDEMPQLVVTRIWDQRTTRIYLKGDRPAHVFVLNIGESGDHDADFLLHYFVTTWTPPAGMILRPVLHPDMRTVTDEDGLCHLHHLPGGLTFGCSVSAYP
ncbi:MAG TPA: hypothetical protein VF432_13095 [Thermoanaerobaculia bacterium]